MRRQGMTDWEEPEAVVKDMIVWEEARAVVKDIVAKSIGCDDGWRRVGRFRRLEKVRVVEGM